MVATGRKVMIAFGLNIAAGLSTCIGGIIIFNKKLIRLASPSSLGIALGMSAGVMLFISLVEIFKKSVDNFAAGLGGKEKDACDKMCKGNSWALATVCFIAGAAIIFLIDYIVHKISPDADHELEVDGLNALRQSLSQADSNHGSDPLEEQTRHNKKKHFDDKATKQALNRTGILTALAIAIHNIPEGIATYIGTLEDPKLGVVLAISIALHNIPEGIAVAVPVYFATGSRLKAFLWTFVSALAEPLGGVICWLIIGNGLNGNVNGVMFGLVAGMMVTISIKELIPTAHRFCSSGEKITYSILGGMSLMALSLILFAYAGL